MCAVAVSTVVFCDGNDARENEKATKVGWIIPVGVSALRNPSVNTRYAPDSTA